MGLIKREFICSNESYTSQGQEKTSWHRIGEILTFESKNGGHFRKCKLYAHPMISYTVFKDERQQQAPPPPAPQNSMQGDDNLPF